MCLCQSHTTVHRACSLGDVILHKVPSDDEDRMRGEALEKAINEDIDNGMVPFYVSLIIS